MKKADSNVASWPQQSFRSKNNVSWFEQNMHAQCVVPLPQCSFCSMRNLKKFCELLQPVCMYCSADGAVVGSVIWIPNDHGIGYSLENCMPSKEMSDWFNRTSPSEIVNVASQMAHNAIAKNESHQGGACMSQTKPACVDLRTMKLVQANKQK